MLRGGQVKEIYELKGQGYSAREIARTLGLARNTVLGYLLVATLKCAKAASWN